MLGLIGTKPLDQHPDLKSTICSRTSPRERHSALGKLADARVIEVNENGHSNWIILVGPKRSVTTELIYFPGASGNIVVLGENSDQPRSIRFEGSGNIALCGDSIRWAQVTLRFVSDEAVISLGHGSIYNGTSIIAEGPGCGVEIGKDALFAPGTTIRTSDLHGMYDVGTGEWLNPPSKVVIEPHTWFGQDALVLKGAWVGGGSVIAARAVVNGRLPQFSVSAGSPARQVREGVCWSLERTAHPEQLACVKELLREFAEIDAGRQTV